MKATRTRKHGRPSKLSAALTKRICKLLEQGSTIKSACIISGFSERSFYDWQERGKAGEVPFATFFSAATRARERHKMRLIDIVLRAADKDARHAEWLLERQFPREFAPVTRCDRELAPPEEAKIPYTLLIDTGGKSLRQLTHYPVIKGQPESPAAEQRSDGGDDGDLNSMLRRNRDSP